jgi:transcriptional regulator with XRE-family HTH domain
MPRKRDGTAADLSRRVHERFGDRLAKARGERDLLQSDFGTRMGLSRTSVSNIERGTRAIFLDQVYQAARILGVDARDLLPSMEEVYPAETVHVAQDDLIPAEGVHRALEMVRERLDSGSHNRRRKTTRK